LRQNHAQKLYLRGKPSTFISPRSKIKMAKINTVLIGFIQVVCKQNYARM